jgi:hypothetical protein
MTLQASGPISLTDVLNELRIANSGRGATVSLGDSDVLSLVGKGGAPISLSDLYGKSAFKVAGNNASSSQSSINAGGTSSASPSVTVIGGSGTITYQWTMTSYTGMTPTLSNANGSYCQVSRTFGKLTDGSFDAVLQCVVTNGNGATATVTGITAHGDWYSNR